jgi:bifunctional N-acetylglucosamine-1-phosphate-uridyltransferase/glucosamine-1-phosphate-acetyltransferase GlmU-like protein
MSEFRHPEAAAMVLAAGQGTRMKSDLAKVLHPMAGRPLLAYVLDTLGSLHLGRTVVVVGHQRERVLAAFPEARVQWAVQEPQRGTGHAVMVAAPALEGFTGTLLVVYGDTPLLQAGTLDRLLSGHRATGAAATVLSMRLEDPTGYGRIVRRGAIEATVPSAETRGSAAAATVPSAETRGSAAEPMVPAPILRIVEHRDATEAERAIDEVNSGIYVFEYPKLERVLSHLSAHNAQGEYYLTDSIALLAGEGEKTQVMCTADERELLGINTVEQLAEAERTWRELVGPGRRP